MKFTGNAKPYVALFDRLTWGETFSGQQVHCPIPIIFDRDQTSKKFVTRIKGPIFIFEKIGTQNIAVAPYPQVQE